MSEITQRLITLKGNIGTVRVASFQGRDHVVVPIVALIGDQVVWPANSDTPEYVPADELARAATSWTGRPAVGAHPVIDGRFVSANRRDVMETKVFGRVMESSFSSDKKLEMEVWLDPAAAERVGADAVDVVNRALAREPIEVSVGAMVEVEPVAGVAPNGKQYHGRWRNIGSDHIAFLPRGVRGACNNDMGCGLRAAHAHVITAEGLALAPDTERRPAQGYAPKTTEGQSQFVGSETSKEDSGVEKKGMLAKLRSLLGASTGDELEPSAEDQLRDVVTELVVAYGKRNSAADQRMIQTVHDHSVTLGALCADSAAKPTALASGEDGNNDSVDDDAKEHDMKPLAERVKALIEASPVPFTPCEVQKMLEGASEDRLKALESHFTPTKPPETPTPAPTPASEPQPQPTPVPPKGMAFVTVEELGALRTLQAAHEQQQAARKSELVALLDGKTNGAFTADELKALSVSDLEKIAVLAQVDAPQPTSRVGKVLASVGDADNDEVPPPPSMESVARALAAGKDPFAAAQ